MTDHSRWTAGDLKGGRLLELRAATARPGERERLLANAAAVDPAQQAREREAYVRLWGWRPPDEHLEWARACAGQRFVLESGLSFSGDLLGYAASWAEALDLDAILGSQDHMMTVLHGLELAGPGYDGDRWFASTLPGPLGTAEVCKYDHEDGSVRHESASIAAFVATHADAARPVPEEVLREFKAEGRKALEGRPVHEDPVALFARSRWLYPLPQGRTTHAFAEDVVRAPEFATWEAERAAFEEAPVLANYWMLAHLFLGNERACREAIALAKELPAVFTRALAERLEALLAAPGAAKLGRLDAARLDPLRARVRANALEAQLEPERRRASRRTAGPDPLARLAAGEDPAALMRELPDDVELHDQLLRALGKREPRLGAEVERYLEERSEGAGDATWPGADDAGGALAPALSLAMSLAFRAGLARDDRHPQAYAGVVRALGHVDDDEAMTSFAQALEALPAEDKRTDAVVRELLRSKHPRRAALLRKAAWAYVRDTAARAQVIAAEPGGFEELELRGLLVPDRRAQALEELLDGGDPEAEGLAAGVLAHAAGVDVFGCGAGRAFRAAAGLGRAEWASAAARYYCEGVPRRAAAQKRKLVEEEVFTLSEAAVALARLAPAEARRILEPLFEGAAGPRGLQLDVRACALAGLAVLSPGDARLAAAADRVVRDRTMPHRVYGALRAVAAGKLPVDPAALARQCYGGAMEMNPREPIRAARAAVAALGLPDPPPFDRRYASTRSCTRLRGPQLVAALERPWRYEAECAFRRMEEEGLVGPEYLEAARAWIASALESMEEPGASAPGGWNALRVLVAQGQAARPVLEAFAAHEKLGEDDRAFARRALEALGEGGR